MPTLGGRHNQFILSLLIQKYIFIYRESEYYYFSDFEIIFTPQWIQNKDCNIFLIKWLNYINCDDIKALTLGLRQSKWCGVIQDVLNIPMIMDLSADAGDNSSRVQQASSINWFSKWIIQGCVPSRLVTPGGWINNPQHPVRARFNC